MREDTLQIIEEYSINPLLLKGWIALLFLYNNIIIVDVTITPMLKVIKNILLSDNV